MVADAVSGHQEEDTKVEFFVVVLLMYVLWPHLEDEKSRQPLDTTDRKLQKQTAGEHGVK